MASDPNAPVALANIAAAINLQRGVITLRIQQGLVGLPEERDIPIGVWLMITGELNKKMAAQMGVGVSALHSPAAPAPAAPARGE